jgi:hypothetical protein
MAASDAAARTGRGPCALTLDLAGLLTRIIALLVSW